MNRRGFFQRAAVAVASVAVPMLAPRVPIADRVDWQGRVYVGRPAGMLLTTGNRNWGAREVDIDWVSAP